MLIFWQIQETMFEVIVKEEFQNSVPGNDDSAEEVFKLSTGHKKDMFH